MGNTALVTGASHGIGYEMSRLFARNGYNLVLVARNAQRLKEIAAEFKGVFGINAMVIARDLSVQGAAEEIFAELEWDRVHVDILVNNAGFQEYGPFSKTDLHKELQMIQVHITALTCLTKLFLPGMLKRDHGRILNVGSTGSFTPGGPFNAVYCATKTYVLSFSEAISEELKGTGVTVTALCPGATNTEFARRADIEDIRLFKFRCGVMKARTVAEAGYRAMMKGERSVVAGMANKLTVLSLKWMPRRLMTTTAKLLMSRG
jgi:short-subunit dehydrogenase